jgi:hypothetical protein
MNKRNELLLEAIDRDIHQELTDLFNPHFYRGLDSLRQVYEKYRLCDHPDYFKHLSLFVLGKVADLLDEQDYDKALHLARHTDNLNTDFKLNEEDLACYTQLTKALLLLYEGRLHKGRLHKGQLVRGKLDHAT